MGQFFNIVFRIISSLLGLALLGFGVVFILQGLDLAFNGPINGGEKSFMVGDKHWILYGAIFALVGLGQVVWSNTRPKG